MVPACLQGMQRAPSKRTEGIESLTVAFIFGLGPRAEESWGLELFLNRVLNSCDPSQGRRARTGFYWAGLRAPPNDAPSRRFHYDRYIDSGVVDKKSVLLFPVFAQRLAVIA